MTKKYIYLTILILSTIALTLLLSYIYKKETTIETSYSYENLNKITSSEFDEYILENPDTIIYIADKNDISNNKFEKKFIKKLEKLNLLDNIVYIDKTEITKKFKKNLSSEYSYNYNGKKLPIILITNDKQIVQVSLIDEYSDVNTVIDYGVFEW